MPPFDPSLTDAQILSFKARAAGLVADRPEMRMAVSIVRTLSKNLTDEEWIGLYRGVTPAINPLSPKQLEALRGGWRGSSDELPFPFPPFPR